MKRTPSKSALMERIPEEAIASSSDQTENKDMNNTQGVVFQHEIIDIDEMSQSHNDGPGRNASVTFKRNLSSEDYNARRISVRKRTNFSRMLLNADSSSDEDDEFTDERFATSGSFMGVVESESERTDESITIKELTKFVSPKVLSRVMAHLKTASGNVLGMESPVSTPDLSPNKLLETKMRKQNENMLHNKKQAGKADFKIRKHLKSLPEGETVNTLYLSLVKHKMLREVEALFSYAEMPGKLPIFDKNYCDVDEKSALAIAIDNRDEEMMGKLIEHGVALGRSIFHVISSDFIGGLKLLMLWDPCIDSKIERKDHFYKIGMTPIILAAHNNNYRMLSLLYECGHRLTELKDWSEGIQLAWESSNERRMIRLARAQPAYITLTCEINRMNPMTYCLKEIKRVKVYKNREHEYSGFYSGIIMQLEDYMCSLLDFISSSSELAQVFRFEIPPMQAKNSLDVRSYVDIANPERWKLENRFELLEMASRENLVRVVTHHQSQLALSYLRFRSLPFLRNRYFALAIGLLFPILSIFYVCAPRSTLGGIITLPTVSFNCHMMSDFAFAFILLLKIALKESSNGHLGEPFTVLEYIVCLWILGKWLQEAQECINRGLKSYLRDYWNYSDLVLLLLFTLGFAIRIFDVIQNGHNTVHTPRYKWDSFEPRLIGEGLLAWGYVFVFIRILGLTRVDRNLGPLTISLAKMLGDITRFLLLFTLVLLAFAFGLSDLYWYYDTPEADHLFCETNHTSLENDTVTVCKRAQTAFSSIGDSIIRLFWALFGLFELSSMSLAGKHTYTQTVGMTLVATYHVVAITVMLNMLIAMMSNSFNTTSEDEETAWKFHRTSVWIRYIKREITRPPPMNLIPNPFWIAEIGVRAKKFFQRLCPRRGLLSDNRTAQFDRFAETNYRYRHGKQIENEEVKPGNLDKHELIKSENWQQDRAPTVIKPQQPGLGRNAFHKTRDKLVLCLHAGGSKEVLSMLMRRYKLEHLVTKSK